MPRSTGKNAEGQDFLRELFKWMKITKEDRMEAQKVRDALEKTLDATLTTLFSEKPRLSPVRVDAKSNEEVVVASIGLNGYWNGSLVIVSSLPSVRALVSKMLNSEITDDRSQDIVDGIGELLNIFAGSMKRLLKEKLGHFEHSL